MRISPLLVLENMRVSRCRSVSLSTLAVTMKEVLSVGYVVDDKKEPILPPGMKDHLKADLNRTIDDF